MICGVVTQEGQRPLGYRTEESMKKSREHNPDFFKKVKNGGEIHVSGREKRKQHDKYPRFRGLERWRPSGQSLLGRGTRLWNVREEGRLRVKGGKGRSTRGKYHALSLRTNFRGDLGLGVVGQSVHSRFSM